MTAIESTDKAALRRLLHQRRAALSESERAAASRSVANHFLQSYHPISDQVVAGYWPIRDEVDCRPVLRALLDREQPVALPVVMGKDTPLQFRRWEAETALVEAAFGTLAPPATAEVVVPDVLLLPLLGFDRDGTRLGYGGGFYDRTLADLPRRPRLIGLAFAAQQLDHIPREPHDVPLDLVVTEAGVLNFRAEA